MGTIITFWSSIILETKADLYRLTLILGRSGKDTIGVYEATTWEKLAWGFVKGRKKRKRGLGPWHS